MTPGGYVFISGRYGDYDGYLAIERRIGRVREHAARLARAGIPYFAPHLNSAHFEVVVPDVPREFWLRLDGTFLAGARAMLVVTEGAHTSGVQNDIAQAAALTIPTYWTEHIDQLIAEWEHTASMGGAWRGADHG